MDLIEYFKKVRRFLIRKSFKFYDPIVYKKIGGFKLKMKRSHMLPYYLSDLPYYDRALPRICSILSKNKTIKVIDVGANIGDTVALISQKADADFLCIDGDLEYFKLLKENTKQFSTKIVCENVYLGDSKEKSNFNVFSNNGTARLIMSDLVGSNSRIKMVSLDSLLKKNNYFAHSDLIKVDTDGYELSVFNGSKNFLKKAKPLVYFEFTPANMVQFGQNPTELLDLFYNLGYKEALFYTNFGVAKKIVKLNDKKQIDEILKLIDNKKVCYYDLLLAHESSKFKFILNKELNLFK